MSKHTPGPWSKHPFSTPEPFLVQSAAGSPPFLAYSVTIGSGDKRICDAIMHSGCNTGSWPSVDSRDECDANARLIAAAPELLELANFALAYIDAIPKDTALPGMPGFDRDWADSVIAKAKGEA